MKLILERWNQFVNEAEGPYEEIQAIIDGNQYLKGNVTASEETVYDMGDKYFLMSGVSHIAERHTGRVYRHRGPWYGALGESDTRRDRRLRRL